MAVFPCEWAGWRHQCWCPQHHKSAAGLTAALTLNISAFSPFCCKELQICLLILDLEFLGQNWIFFFNFKASDTLLNSLSDTVTHPPTACEHACRPPVWQPWELQVLDAINPIHEQWCCISTVKTETFPFVYWRLLLLSWRTQFCTLPIVYWGFTFFFMFRIINFNLLIFISFKCIKNSPTPFILSC